jgi:hypothetical protein
MQHPTYSLDTISYGQFIESVYTPYGGGSGGGSGYANGSWTSGAGGGGGGVCFISARQIIPPTDGIAYIQSYGGIGGDAAANGGTNNGAGTGAGGGGGGGGGIVVIISKTDVKSLQNLIVQVNGGIGGINAGNAVTASVASSGISGIVAYGITSDEFGLKR